MKWKPVTRHTTGKDGSGKKKIKTMEELSEENGQSQENICIHCGHPMDPHILVAYSDPLDGGLIFCQDLGTCDCVSTWAVEERETGTNTVMPPPHVVAEWRGALIESHKSD